MQKQKGFTLIELLVVISIVGLLSTFAFATLQTAKAKARDAIRIANLERLQDAIDIYQNEKGWYPPNQIAYLGTDVIGVTCLDSRNTSPFKTQIDCGQPNWEIIMQNIPIDPSNPDPIVGNVCNWFWIGHPCIWYYKSTGGASGSTYTIQLYFETDNELTGAPGRWGIDQDRNLTNW